MIAYSGYVMTLANSIIGVGILAMPFCFLKCGIALAIVLLVLSNWVTRLCCHYLIKTSLLTRRRSFEFLGLQAFGSSGKLLVELCIIGYLLGTCITYFVVVGDLGPQIVSKMLSLDDSHCHLRTLVMLTVTMVCILPLSMLKNVDSLSTVCTASVGFYVCLVVKIVLESQTHIINNDWPQKVAYWQPSGILQCLPIISMALSCQMQLFEVFTSINNQSLEKLNGIVRSATWICTFVYIAVGFFGYVAFCTQTFSGNILVNFSPSFGSDVIKIGFVLSVAFSFPLVIFPCRASIYSLLYRKGQTDAAGYIPETRFKVITVFIVFFTLSIALMIPSVELIIGLVGSTIGVAICIMFPAACYSKIIKKHSNERNLAQFIVISGFCLMILGTYANLNAIDEKSSGAHIDLPKMAESFPQKPTEVARDLKDSLKQNEEKIKLNFDKKGDVSDLQKNVKLKEMERQKPASDAKVPPSAMPNKGPQPQLQEKFIKEVEAGFPSPVAERTIVSNKTNTKTEADNRNVPLEGKKEVRSETMVTAQPAPPPQQTIDNDAIKKEEEVAAEESKNQKGVNEDELKKTQHELKKTKELLEKRVDELKVELAKQNKETQHLVVEKLGEVVEKFEQIERKVQAQKDPKDTIKDQKEEEKVAEEKVAPNDTNILNVNKSSLLNILTDKRKLEDKAQNAQVYEPLSYKTGELIGKINKEPERRLPLPLALLMNSSQAKRNESLFAKPDLEKKDPSQNAETEANIPIRSKGEQPNITNAEHGAKEGQQRGNIEGMRRELLQLNEDRLREDATTAEVLHDRVKRSNNEADHQRDHDYAKDKCLNELKLET